MTSVLHEKKDCIKHQRTGSRFRGFCLLFLIACVCAGLFCPASARAEAGPKSAVEGIIAAVDNADADAFEKSMDITSVARHVFTELETMGKMPEYAGQMPPMLALLVNQNAFTSPVTQDLLLSEVRKFVRYGVGSGAFAGKKVENYKGESMMAPLFSLLSMGKKVISNFLKWIAGVSLTTGDGNAGGHFRVDYNNGSTPYETDLTWVKGIEIADDGTVTYTYAGGAYADGKQYVSNLVKWISSVDLNANNGHFRVMLNNGTAALEKDLDWVKDVSIDESTGAIVMNHTTGDVTSAAKLKLLTGMTVSSDGIPTLHFNTGSDDDFTMKGDDGKDYHIKTITNVTLNTGIREDKHINVTYNTDQAKPSPIGNSINFVRDMVVRPADWHLFVLYDDAAHRATPDSLVTDVVIENSKKVSGKDANGISWLSSTKVAGFTGSSYTGATYDIDSSMTIADLPYDVYWRDLGAIKDQAGVLIGGNITSATIEAEGYSDILVYLNAKYPSGLTGESNVFGGQSTKEKIITYQPTDDDTADKEFYAFDYNAMSWYFLGRIADTGSRDVKLIAKTEISAANLEKLNTEGLAFITQVVSASTTEIPDYWSPSYKFV